jgi:hypothetical protein
VHDYDSDPPVLQVMLMLEATIDCDEDVKLLFNEVQQEMILQPVPTELDSGPDLVTGKDIRRTRSGVSRRNR